MIGSKKKIIAIVLFVLLSAGLFACGKRGPWIFSLNGEKIYEADVMAFGLVYTREHNILDKELMERSYDNGGTYGDYYKKELEDEILSTALLYKEARQAQIELSEEMQQEAQKKAEEMVGACDEEWISKIDISVSDVERVYKMKLLGEAYMNILSQKGDNADAKTGRYIKVYQVTFPTVALDKDGMLDTDEDGSVKKLSGSLIAQRKADALDLIEKAREGGDIRTLSKAYGQSVTGIEKYLKYDDLEEEYKRAVDAVSEHEISNVIEASYGFYVIELIEADADEYADTVASYEEVVEVQGAKDEILDELYKNYVRDDKDYKNEERWKRITIQSLIQ